MELVRVQPEDSRERRAAPRELDEAVLRRIYDSGIVGVAVWDGIGRILQANDRFLEIVGYSRAELDARQLDWQRLSAGGEPQPWQAMPHQRSGSAYQPEFKRYVRSDGEPVYVRVHSTVLGGNGKTLSIVVDATEQRKAQDERDALLARERAAREEAEAAVRSRDDILAIVSHDLRNPLNTISMSLSLIEMDQTRERSLAQAGIIRRAIGNMTRLIQDLLDVNQIAAGQLVVKPEPVEVAALLEDSRATIAALAMRKSQRLEISADEGGVVLADRDRVGQVLSNLAGNAAKFTPEGGRIEVRADAVAEGVRFMVRDSGPGLASEDLPHVFDRFWQARKVRRGGVGLGLPITKGIIDAHGGRIWVESSAGVGTTFYFTLPLAPVR